MGHLDLLPALPHPAEHPARVHLQFPNADRSHIDLQMVTNVATIITGPAIRVNERKVGAQGAVCTLCK
jgi:hypothetical protein